MLFFLKKRKFITEPLANYNVLVLNQTFEANSSVSLINTNVTRRGNYINAIVTSVLFNYHTKSN